VRSGSFADSRRNLSSEGFFGLFQREKKVKEISLPVLTFGRKSF